MNTDHSYYGRMDLSKKPKEGVVTLMLNEHIINTVDKEKDKFRKELSDVISSFQRSLDGRLDKIEKDIVSINESLKSNRKFTTDLAKLNSLSVPVIIASDVRRVKTRKDYD